MTDLSSDLVNGFARGIVGQFTLTAKGLDQGSGRFIAARPYERILTGFLTPVGMGDGDDSSAPEGDGLPELPVDDSYEQTNIGFEWSVPIASVRAGMRIQVSVGLNVYARVLPTLQEAQENARFDRQGQATVVEAWQRFTLAGRENSTLVATLELDRLVREGARQESLAGQASLAWSRVAPGGHPLFPGRKQLSITANDIADASAFASWVASVTAKNQGAPSLWDPAIDVRVFPSPTEAGAVRLLLRLVNLTPPVDKRTAAFVDPRVYAVDLTAEFPAEAHQATEFRILPQSYRYDRKVVAIGINCQPRSAHSGTSLSLRAETVPTTETPRLEPREVDRGEPTFEALADHDKGSAVLRTIEQAMRAYDGSSWAGKVDSLSAPEERRDALTDREVFGEEIAKFSAGVALLGQAKDTPVGTAFRLMNETMRRIGQRRRRREFKKWHLFQLVYIVSMIPKLKALAEGAGGSAVLPLNILWFPAGGGKTEAFLGLILWHAFFDRLRGKPFGVTALLRYPLRLLTYQQLQRISWALGQAEEVRVEAGIQGQPFTLGYYVGESTTPNSISDIEDRKLRATGVPANWQRVFQCPTCGRRSVGLRYNASLRLIEHYCQSTDCRSKGGRLQVYIVDDDLYRYLPTVIVSTVDKLAQLGQNRRFSQLLGRIEFFCPVHGAAFGGSNRGLCDASRERQAGNDPSTCGGEALAKGPFPFLGPSLHVQDEMHLLRESLATFDSHYETTALALQRSLDADGTEGWALIGSTATIEGYREQSNHLYLRDAVRFPAPGPEAYDSFYYTTDPDLIGRLYVGVLGVGRTHTPAVARAIGLLHGIVERVRHDPTSARQYLNLPGASSEQLTLLAFLYEIVLTYVLTRKGGDQVGEAIDTRVRRDVEQIAGGNLRVETFNSSVDMPRMIETMEEIESGTPDTPIGERVRGVVATNIISHGVDIDRFNVMVFAGLPRQMAEYIQASARIGRQLPGVSVLVVTPQAERDRSVFDRFEKFHQYVDRLVEPVPVNRWSESALELTLRGILASYLMGVVPRQLGREIYLVQHVKELFGRPGAEMLNEPFVVDWVLEAVGANSTWAPASFTAAARILAANYYGKITGASNDQDREPLNTFLGSMRSLRDVDDPAWIRVSSDRDAQTLSALGM